MKKIILFIIVLVSFFVLSSCKSDVIIVSQPVGYGLIDDNHVGKGSFRFESSIPNNPNQIELKVYTLPQIWGELDIDTLNENNPYVIIYDNGSEIKYFAKYILIGDALFTCVLDLTSDNKPIRYEDENEVEIANLLTTEEMAKWYIEQIDFQNATIVDNERIEYSMHKSIMDTPDKNDPFQILESDNQVIMINYIDENESFPDLDYLFEAYDTSLVNQLFSRVLSKAFDSEYIIGEFYNSKG